MNRWQARFSQGYASSPRTVPGLEPARRSIRTAAFGQAGSFGGETGGDALARLLPESGHLFFPFR